MGKFHEKIEQGTTPWLRKKKLYSEFSANFQNKIYSVY